MIQNITELPQGILILDSNSINFGSQKTIQLLKQIIDNHKKNQNVSNLKVSDLISNVNAPINPFIIIPSNMIFQQSIASQNNIQNQLPGSLKKSLFTYKEDKLLLKLVSTYGDKDWQAISLLMKKNNFNRNVRQCKDRYFHYLDPKISTNSEWTKEQDELLLKKVEELGNKWKSMEKLFPGRTEIALRNRYKLLLRKESKGKGKKGRKKKNILSDDFSFLDNLHPSHPNNNENKNKNIKSTPNSFDESIVQETKKEDLSIENLNSDLYFNELIDHESEVWLDEKFSQEGFYEYL